jgi:hypothetical protein
MIVDARPLYHVTHIRHLADIYRLGLIPQEPCDRWYSIWPGMDRTVAVYLWREFYEATRYVEWDTQAYGPGMHRILRVRGLDPSKLLPDPNAPRDAVLYLDTIQQSQIEVLDWRACEWEPPYSSVQWLERSAIGWKLVERALPWDVAIRGGDDGFRPEGARRKRAARRR